MSAERDDLRAVRGRHAPPSGVRLPVQRERLLQAAAREFAQRGYAGASSDSISRRAGMSKATFYEHFANKEGCMFALFDRAAEVVADALDGAAQRSGRATAVERMTAASHAFLSSLSQHRELAQTLLVEIIGAGPAAAQRRDEIMQRFADVLDAENAHAAERGLIGRFASPHDSFAVVGAITELVSRQVRLGEPEDAMELAPVIDRLLAGVLVAPAQ